MSNGELAYLVMVIVAVLVFIVTLAWVSRRERPGTRAARSKSWSSESSSSPTFHPR